MLAVAAAVLIAASSQATLDKTFVCSTEHQDVDVVASPRGDLAFATAQTVSSGYLGLNTGYLGGRANLAFVRARREKSGISTVAAQAEGVYAGAGRCFLSRKTVPLTSTGLVGPPVAWAKDYACTIRGRLLVRVRATVASPAGWRRVDASFYGVRTNVSAAQLAVRSERTGKPVSFATLDSAGRTKLWVASACG